MTYAQKVTIWIIFFAVYGMAAWMLFKEDQQSKINAETCPLCGQQAPK